MANKICVLDDLTVNKIAAGEVVEGPFSVVKELVENAIDAGASSIVLEVKEGGKKFIRITDNGSGIAEEDVEKAFMRHSTSKIQKIEDLYNIVSLGFRGEALASIAAVSQVEMITRPNNQQYGTVIEISGGKINSQKPVGCPIGTTVIIKNLFFNTPARLKFMKSTQGETIKISEIITRLALSHPDISFQYINNNNIMFTTPGKGKLSDSILSVFEKNTFKNLIPLNTENEDYKLQGYIGQPSFVRGNRNFQIIFVNGRYVKNKIMSKALEEAYAGKIMINKFPICILNLKVDPASIDMNVHPAKIEIKFNDEKSIYQFIYTTVSKRLEEYTLIPRLSIIEQPKESLKEPIVLDGIEDIDIKKDQKSNNIKEGLVTNFSTTIKEDTDPYIPKNSPFSGNTNNTLDSSKNMDFFGDKGLENNPTISSDGIGETVLEQKENIQKNFIETLLDDFNIIGQLFNTYIILEKEKAVYLIDQHAAHEKLLYNQFIDEFKREKIVSQELVAPEVLSCSTEDYLLLYDNLEVFKKLGFYLEEFGHNSFIIRSVPLILGIPQNFNFIYDVLDEIKNNNNKIHFNEKIIKKACKQAVKAKDRLNEREIMALMEDLKTLKPPLTCPHGRPIILTLSQYEIEKYFKRIQ